jgi:hypothetical protein
MAAKLHWTGCAQNIPREMQYAHRGQRRLLGGLSQSAVTNRESDITPIVLYATISQTAATISRTTNADYALDDDTKYDRVELVLLVLMALV